MIWNWDFAVAILPAILQGLAVTLQAVALGMTIALALGLFWAIVRRSPRRWIRWPANLIVEFIRSTPLLVQIFFVFFVFPHLGLTLSPLTAGVLALGVHYSCYTAEVYRAGINAVSRGQWEAARALNLSRFATYRHVVLPQAIPPIIPALGNYLIAMFKDAPLLSAITVLGILQRAKNIGNETGSYLEPMTIVGVVFLILSLLAGLAVGWLDRRLKLKTS
ncbi:MAG: ectoine/hydroxyectoine ABC transporter permease subunit EhuD [Pirellulales bacterium]